MYTVPIPKSLRAAGNCRGYNPPGHCPALGRIHGRHPHSCCQAAASVTPAPGGAISLATAQHLVESRAGTPQLLPSSSLGYPRSRGCCHPGHSPALGRIHGRHPHSCCQFPASVTPLAGGAVTLATAQHLVESKAGTPTAAGKLQPRLPPLQGVQSPWPLPSTW